MTFAVKEAAENKADQVIQRISLQLQRISKEEILAMDLDRLFEGIMKMSIRPIQVEDAKAKEYVRFAIKEAYRVYYLASDPSVEWPIEKVRKRYGITSSRTLPDWRAHLGIKVEPKEDKSGKKRSPNCPSYVSQEELELLDLYYIFFSSKSKQNFYKKLDYSVIIETPVYDENFNQIGYQTFNDVFIKDNPTFFSWQHFVLDQEINKGKQLLNVNL